MKANLTDFIDKLDNTPIEILEYLQSNQIDTVVNDITTSKKIKYKTVEFVREWGNLKKLLKIAIELSMNKFKNEN